MFFLRLAKIFVSEPMSVMKLGLCFCEAGFDGLPRKDSGMLGLDPFLKLGLGPKVLPTRTLMRKKHGVL